MGSYRGLWWGHTGILCVSYRDLWWGLTGIFGGVLLVSCSGVLQDNLLICLLFSLIVVFRNGLFRDLHGLFCIVKHTYQEMSGISIYESYCIFL